MLILKKKYFPKEKKFSHLSGKGGISYAYLDKKIFIFVQKFLTLKQRNQFFCQALHFWCALNTAVLYFMLAKFNKLIRALVCAGIYVYENLIDLICFRTNFNKLP